MLLSSGISPCQQFRWRKCLCTRGLTTPSSNLISPWTLPQILRPPIREDSGCEAFASVESSLLLSDLRKDVHWRRKHYVYLALESVLRPDFLYELCPLEVRGTADWIYNRCPTRVLPPVSLLHNLFACWAMRNVLLCQKNSASASPSRICPPVRCVFVHAKTGSCFLLTGSGSGKLICRAEAVSGSDFLSTCASLASWITPWRNITLLYAQARIPIRVDAKNKRCKLETPESKLQDARKSHEFCCDVSEFLQRNKFRIFRVDDAFFRFGLTLSQLWNAVRSVVRFPLP